MEVLFSITDFMPSEEDCVKALRKLRWPDGITCPRCGLSSIWKFSPAKGATHRYICNRCDRTFTDLTGTIFERSKIRLDEWFYMARELQRNTSMNQISKDLGRKYDNVMHACHKIMDNIFIKRLIELEGKDIEVDEMYQSAGGKGKKQKNREPRKRGLKLRGRGDIRKGQTPNCCCRFPKWQDYNRSVQKTEHEKR